MSSREFMPFGFDFFSGDSVEIFCNSTDAERFSTYKTSHDTCRLFRSEKKGAWTFMFERRQDTLKIFREKNTLLYRYISLDKFKSEDLKRIDVADASWNTVVA